MSKQLPDENGFAFEIVDALIGDKASPEVITIVKSLMDHTFGHPWVDEDCEASMAQNICREFDIEVPAEYGEDSEAS